MGLFHLLAAGALGCAFVALALRLQYDRTSAAAIRVFGCSILNLALLFVTMAVDRALHTQTACFHIARIRFEDVPQCPLASGDNDRCALCPCSRYCRPASAEPARFRGLDCATAVVLTGGTDVARIV